MKVIGIEGMTAEEIRNEITRGGIFVVYQYCFSIIVMTFVRSSSIHFIKSGQDRAAKAAPFTLLTWLFGWWGIPWGPIRTIQTLMVNNSGGKDVTQAIISSIGVTIAPAPPVHRPIPD